MARRRRRLGWSPQVHELHARGEIHGFKKFVAEAKKYAASGECPSALRALVTAAQRAGGFQAEREGATSKVRSRQPGVHRRLQATASKVEACFRKRKSH